MKNRSKKSLRWIALITLFLLLFLILLEDSGVDTSLVSTHYKSSSIDNRINYNLTDLFFDLTILSWGVGLVYLAKNHDYKMKIYGYAFIIISAFSVISELIII
ncbi:MAG: hypothetical protein N4J56_007908 [Chroococcidiopsis sp. SAG 2025]|nr:hypothetical protein [Chroococcidiopsis sp. SAG 2025]